VVKPAPQQSRHLGPGDELGRYELIRQIAIGGMAELYLARTLGFEGFEKLVVIKRILPQFSNTTSFVAMFTNEARLAATLQHPNVAQVYDIGIDDGDYFFAMEYVHGEDLHRTMLQSLEQGVPISLEFALTLGTGLCAGLHYAHEKAGPDGTPLQIVHRDVSPSNVLVSYDGAVKLVDFGIARGAQGKVITATGLKGKIIYMSPEQCRADAALDRRSDIYSVGTILYELTCGRTPFHGTDYAILNQIVGSEVPPPSTIVPNFPPVLEAIIVRALARDPDHRYATALELQGALVEFAHDSRLRISPLVLARFMGSLFPARLEEWAEAKSQGAFFVEQHVVQTLIESGKTPDPNDPETRAQIKAMAERLGIEDPTALTRLPLDLDDEVPNHIAHPELRRSQPPRQVPFELAPGAPPLYTHGYQPPHGGTMVSHPQSAVNATPGALYAHAVAGAVPIDTPRHADVTDRVAVRRLASPTNFIKLPPRRNKILAGVGILAVGSGIAAFIAFGGGSSSEKLAPSAVADPPTLVLTTPAVQPTVQPIEQPLEQPIPDAAEPAKTLEEPPAVEVPVAKSAAVSHVAKPVAKKNSRPKPRPVAKSKEDKTWDADSPFMPVRSDKH